ncbi:hypothetical protein T4C_6697 [Trichinella pseudospiralis]|uniref:Uncharacterized protein n=1 Tax=Trichinella pseudospiralis TaxID=6337 RepID=A0A0V1JPM4_TRIPS|nr:hypothetical protein T4C_6697 [Trichinella pseudospiralis]
MTGEKLGTEMANEMPIWALIIHVRCFTMNNSKSNLYPQDLLSDVKRSTELANRISTYKHYCKISTAKFSNVECMLEGRVTYEDILSLMFIEREREEKRASEREGERENKRLAYARAHLGCRLETIWLITMQKAAKITLARLAHCSGMIDGFPLNMQQRADGKRNFSELSNG